MKTCRDRDLRAAEKEDLGRGVYGQKTPPSIKAFDKPGLSLAEAREFGRDSSREWSPHPSMGPLLSSPVYELFFPSTIVAPGETELGSAGEQPNKG